MAEQLMKVHQKLADKQTVFNTFKQIFDELFEKINVL